MKTEKYKFSLKVGVSARESQPEQIPNCLRNADAVCDCEYVFIFLINCLDFVNDIANIRR